MQLYFDIADNDWTSIPQNATKSGFIDCNTKFKPDPGGTSGLAAYSILSTTKWTYDEFIAYVAGEAIATITNTGGILTDFKAQVQVNAIVTDQFVCFIKKFCGVGDKYIKWLNENGAWEYEYFNMRIQDTSETEQEIEAVSPVFDVKTSLQRQFMTGGKSKIIYTLYKNQIPSKLHWLGTDIDNKARYLDLQKQAKLTDVWLFTGKFVADITITDYSGTVAGTCKAACTEPHKLKTGDEVYLINTQYGAGSYKIYVLSNTEFYIILTYAGGDNVGYFQKKITKYDWKRYKAENVNVNIDNYNHNINLSMDIISPYV